MMISARSAALAAVCLGVGCVIVACAASGTDGGGAGATANAGGAGGDVGDTGGLAIQMTGGSGGGDECLESEICDDGLDNDCNNLVDDDCACEPGTMESCYEGPLDVAGVGACIEGTRYCDNKGEFPTWGPCMGSVLPSAEVCDAAMVDENCDGAPNESCECVDGEVLPCGSGVGACVEGTQLCTAGLLGPCVGEIGPTAETCNNTDDDCNGLVDDGLIQACGSSVGACQPGNSTCSAGQWSSCTGGVGPTNETCNNIDDDCDGSVDEALAQACGTNVGECSEGTQTCAAGSWGACSDIGPSAEQCNLLDDDCDGVSDEGCACTDGSTQPCGTNQGICTAGVQTCMLGQWGACVGATLPQPETCNNLDDDCDGLTDESLTQPCGTNTGICQQGTQTCSAGSWGSCVGAIGPGVESCNNLDDDCDGLTDESLTQQCGVSNVGKCKYGTSTCSMGSYGACVGNVNPSAEICANGIDDDCDGAVDEVAECPQSPPVCNCPPTAIASQPLSTVMLSASCSDPDGGTVSYQWVVTMAPAGSSSQPASPTSASTTFFVDLAGSYEITLYATDDENNTITCVTVITSVPTQDIHIELVWDTAYGDADLHLIQAGIAPAGAWYTSEADCFFGNTSAAWPPNGPSGNAQLDIDDTDGYGPENINIALNPQAGTYNIGVAYYCSHGVQGPGDPPPAPGDGPATATVNVYCGGVLAATYGNINLDKTGRFVHVATITWPSCSGMSIYNNTWTSLVQPPQYTSPLHCALPCTNNNQCGGGEICGASGNCVLQ